MAKVERFPLRMFAKVEQQDIETVLVPEGSKFLGAKILHDGIYVWYEVPEIEAPVLHEEAFVIMSQEKSVPENSDFITILDTFFETPQGQGIMIFPIYKLRA